MAVAGSKQGTRHAIVSRHVDIEATLQCLERACPKVGIAIPCGVKYFLHCRHVRSSVARAKTKFGGGGKHGAPRFEDL